MRSINAWLIIPEAPVCNAMYANIEAIGESPRPAPIGRRDKLALSRWMHSIYDPEYRYRHPNLSWMDTQPRLTDLKKGKYKAFMRELRHYNFVAPGFHRRYTELALHGINVHGRSTRQVTDQQINYKELI